MTLPAPIPLEEAQARLLAMAEPLGGEPVPIAEAAGRYLAAPLKARRTQPPADLSAMDGYAMRADDLAGPWRVIGESAAGRPFQGSLQKGEAIRISTGAITPANGGAILLQEDAAREGDSLRASQGEPTPRHIRRAGFDFRAGEELLHAGAILTSARIALLLASGHATVAVGRQPSLAVLDSGDELASDPEQCPPHQIPASNGAMLAAMAAPLARDVTRIGPVPDNIGPLLQALEQAQETDVLVTSGGASVGDHDLVRPALEQWGATIDFWRVAIKPGKPLLVARRGSQLILGLPGNPVSSYVTAFLFLLPLLRKLAGSDCPVPLPLLEPLVDSLPKSGPRMEFLRGNLGTAGVIPLKQQDSSALSSLATANCLIARPAHSEAEESGDLVRVFPLANGGIA